MKHEGPTPSARLVLPDIPPMAVAGVVATELGIELAAAAEHLALRLGVQDRIHFLGKQDNVNKLPPLADLMIRPSAMESFGLAAMEAIGLLGTRIATRIGGVPELVEDGVNGLLFSVGDTNAMADAAIAVLNDPVSLASMAAVARRTASDHFCTTRIIPHYEAYYERVLARAPTIQL